MEGKQIADNACSERQKAREKQTRNVRFVISPFCFLLFNLKLHAPLLIFFLMLLLIDHPVPRS